MWALDGETQFGGKASNVFFFFQNFRREKYSFDNFKRMWAFMTSPEKALNIAIRHKGD